MRFGCLTVDLVFAEMCLVLAVKFDGSRQPLLVSCSLSKFCSFFQRPCTSLVKPFDG